MTAQQRAPLSPGLPASGRHRDIAYRLEQLTELSRALGGSRDVPRLLERILLTAKDITQAAGGTLYRIDESGQRLEFYISVNDALGMYQGGSSGQAISLPGIPLTLADGRPNLSAVAAYAANQRTSVNIADVYQAGSFNFSGMRRFDEQHGYRSQSFLTVPMQDQAGELVGVLQLVNAMDPAAGQPVAFSATDQHFIEALASQAAVSIANHLLIHRLERTVGELREALRAKTQFIALQQELEIAHKMQLSILPRDFAMHPALSLHAAMLPAKEVGGDFYDFFRLDAHRVALVVADVCGKGVPAAFFMATTRSLLRAIARYTGTAAECVTRVNDLLAADNDEMMFVTMFYAILDTRDGTLSYVNAGHNPPFRLNADGQVGHLAATRGIALAVAEDMPFEEGATTLRPGDGLFLYTDGITDAIDPGECLFGEHRLAALLQDVAAAPAVVITQRVVRDVQAFEAGGPQADDLTCLVVRYLGRGA